MNLEAAEMDKTQTVALVFLQVLLAEWFLGDSINPKQLSKIQFKSISRLRCLYAARIGGAGLCLAGQRAANRAVREGNPTF